LNVARYSWEDCDHNTILTNFAKGYLDALVAVKCLDEGVDIPSVHQAIILASDATERQFIQRRGRILRTAPKKSVATLIDVLIVPPLGDEQVKLIESELQRIKH
jgi:superfamily II DNA or RNA helicase